MADPQQLGLLKRGVEGWNAWRAQHPDVTIDLSGADLAGANLTEADLDGTILTGAKHLDAAKGLDKAINADKAIR